MGKVRIGRRAKSNRVSGVPTGQTKPGRCNSAQNPKRGKPKKHKRPQQGRLASLLHTQTKALQGQAALRSFFEEGLARQHELLSSGVSQVLREESLLRRTPPLSWVQPLVSKDSAVHPQHPTPPLTVHPDKTGRGGRAFLLELAQPLQRLCSKLPSHAP